MVLQNEKMRIVPDNNDRLVNVTFDEIMLLQGKIFRQVKARKTLRFVRDEQVYFAKLHYGIGWREIFKDLLQLRMPVLGAENEWCAIQRLHQLNIATLDLVAYGKRGCNPAQQQSFIITKELQQTITLEDFCRDWSVEPPPFGLKRALLAKVAHIARQIHSQGMNHRDFYLCHFVLQLPLATNLCSSNQLTLYLTDLHRMQIRKKVPRRWLIKDLAGLYFSAMDIGLSQKDLWYFLHCYYQKPLAIIFNKEAKVLKKIICRAKKLYAKTYFVKLKSWQQSIIYDRRYESAAFKRLLLEPNFALASGHLIKHDVTTTLSKIKLGPTHVVLKRYNRKSVWHAIRRAFKPSRALNCWHAAQELLRLNIATATPMAMIEKRFGCLRRNAYYLTEYQQGELVSDIFKQSDQITEQQKQTAEKIYLTLKRLAAHNISHGDMKATNLLIGLPSVLQQAGYQAVECAEQLVLILLDLDAMRQHRCLWRWRRAQQRDIARLLKNWRDQPKVLELFIKLFK